MPEGDAARAAATREWRLLEETARDILACREIRRLYPRGHERVSRAAERVVESVRSYHDAAGRPFAIRPENVLGVDTLGGAGSRIEELAVILHTGRMRSLALLPSLLPESVEGLLSILERSGAEETSRQPSFPGVEIELAAGESESYLFTSEGEQLFTAGAEVGARLAGLPPALGRGISRAFADPETCARAERILARVRDEGAAEDAESVHLIEEWVKLLFPDPLRVVDRSAEEMCRGVMDFLRMVEEAAPHRGEASPAAGGDVLREWLLNAAGSSDWNRPGLPSALRAETASLRRTLVSPPEPEAAIGLDDVGCLFGEQREDGAARQESVRSEAPAPVDLPPSLEQLLELSCDPDQLAAEAMALDFDLLALRIEAERLASADPGSRGNRQERYLRRLSAYPWEGPRGYLGELGDAADGMEGEDAAMDLYIAALATQASQEVVDAFFEDEMRSGRRLVELRPLLDGIARRSSPRCLGTLATLWQRSERERREECLTELFELELDATELCAWGDRHPQIVRSPGFSRRLESIELERLLSTCRSGLGSKRRTRSVGPTARAMLRILARRTGGGAVVAAALRDADRELRHEVLAALSSCGDRGVFLSIQTLIERNNQSSRPDLEEVRLALSALLRSPLPLAEELLRRVRSERTVLLRHTFNRDIRDILELLERAESISR